MIYPGLLASSIRNGISLQTPQNPILNISIKTGTIGANNTMTFGGRR